MPGREFAILKRMNENTKIAVITGSTSGIGKATAIRFAQGGYKVVVTGRSEERGQAVCSEIETKGGQAVFVAADLTKKEDAENLIQKAAGLGAVKVLVNNAGGNNGQSLEGEMTTNFYSAVYCTEATLRIMDENSAVINVASICGCSTVCNDIKYYSAAKAAMLNYAKNLAKSVAPEIRVNSVLPGYTKTPDWGELSEEHEQKWATEVPLRRFIQPEEIADAVWFLAQNSAMTGAELVVDGGLTLN